MSKPSVPILLLIFNRPKETRLVFESIRAARPEKLFIAGDGAREGRPKEAALVEEARAIAKEVDWPCQVFTLFREKNMGCKNSVAGSIAWFFENVEEGIILEDDDRPDPSFYPYVAELLERYRNDERVMHISGTTFLDKSETTEDTSYHFSQMDHIWGWASWRRAWKHYDLQMKDINGLASSNLWKTTFLKKAHFNFWIHLFNHINNKPVDTYDGQWMYSILKNNGVCITPSVNLIENIGFNENATHTTGANTDALPIGTLSFPLKHPKEVKVDMEADKRLMEKVYLRGWKLRLRAFLENFGISI
jgi:hypothetical protein